MISISQHPQLQQQVALFLEQMQERSEADIGASLQAHWQQYPEQRQELEHLFACSDYAGSLCARQPGLLLALLQSGDIQASQDWAARRKALDSQAEVLGGQNWRQGEAGLKRLLRRFRQREMLRIIWRDLNQYASLEETCRDLSALADTCIEFALDLLTPWQCQESGTPVDSKGRPQRMVVLAMGKYGAQELNLSSDIDLIFAFPESGETRQLAQEGEPLRRQTLTNQAFFVKLGQRLIDVLDTVTEDGFVFRVDMRLRPYGGSGALALSFGALEEYYQTQGRDWERFAMIKVRAVSGDQDGRDRLMGILRPFVYRRYLDFATIEALRDMKRMIAQQVRRKGMEDNIKLGAGGIREVEFIVQVLQLIHGGRYRALQQASLFAALQALEAEQTLPAEEVAVLADSYRYLRRLEHCLQALEDRQTQQLPEADLARQRIALAMGHEHWQALCENLQAHRQAVSQRFAELIREEGEGGQEKPGENPLLLSVWLQQVEGEEAHEILSEAGFDQAQEVLQAMAAYRSSRQFLALEKTARERLNRFMVALMEAVQGCEQPSQAFLRVFAFAQAVTRRTAYLVLLLENSLALRQLVDLCSASPWVTEHLSKYPVLLDELLKPLASPPGRDELMADLRQQMLRIPQEDFDQQMEALRYFKQAHVLRVAAADLAQTMPLMKVSDYLSVIAEVILDQVVQTAWEHLVARHGHPLDKQGEAGNLDFVIIAYGKLGGIELNYGSDLDLVFLHDGSPDQDTQAGPEQRAINSAAFYVRLGQRIINMLNTATISGRLYEVDLRLRPSGASGLLVSSMEAFARYQRESAWTWEHQALVRARPVAGSEALAARFEAIRSAVLGAQREPEALQAEVVKMRQRMRRELGTPPSRQAEIFHLKHDAGGIVDIEFIVQYLVLCHGASQPDLLTYPDNMRLIDMAMAHNLLAAEQGDTLKTSYITYRSRLHRQALQQAGNEVVGSEYLVEREAVRAIWQQHFAAAEQALLAAEAGSEG